LERLFARDLGHVRVHEETEARDVTGALDAAAVTRGEDIYLGSESSGDLLTHEVSHVLQQRDAGNLEHDRVGEAGEALEHAADIAVRGAATGQQVSTRQVASAPGAQGQPVRARATRAEAQSALAAFLNRALATQGSRSLRVTREVRYAVLHLFPGPLASMGIEAWLTGVALPRDPDEFAAQVAQRLPETIDRALIDDLGHLPAGPEPAGRLGRLTELVEKSAAGERQQRDQPKEPGSQERFEQTVDDIRRAQGRPIPTTFGPYSVDVLRLGRIMQGLPQAWRGPRAAPAGQPEARTYPEVDRAIDGACPRTQGVGHNAMEERPFSPEHRLRQ
jgi:uncharacterized protein DUF4157